MRAIPVVRLGAVTQKSRVQSLLHHFFKFTFLPYYGEIPTSKSKKFLSYGYLFLEIIYQKLWSCYLEWKNKCWLLRKTTSSHTVKVHGHGVIIYSHLQMEYKIPRLSRTVMISVPQSWIGTIPVFFRPKRLQCILKEMLLYVNLTMF